MFPVFGRFFSILLAVMIIVSNSRSGILSLIVILLFFTQQESAWYKRVWIKYRWVIIILGFSFLIMLYLWKKDSANERFLIWHCSLEMIKERPILGHGPHAFQAEYMLYQAKYLDEYKSHKYVFLANNVKQPFNEFIKIIVEYGLLGGFVTVALCYYLFKLYLLNPKINQPYFGSLIGIGVFSCFSYPLIYPSIKFLVFFNIVMILRYNRKYDFSLKLSRFMAYICTVCSLIYFSYVVYWKRIAYKWYNITLYSVSYSPKVMLPYYQKYYTELSSQWIFLYNYGELLAMSGFYGESIALQKECMKRYNNMDIQLNMANNYIQLGEFSKAEECLILASNMCPSRFVPLFELFKLYQKTNKKVEATEYANLILNKDVKIPSPLITEIKSSVEKFLEYENYDRK